MVAWPGPNDPGYVNIHYKSPKGPGMRGRAFTAIGDFMSFAQSGAVSPGWMTDCYFCLSTQAAHGKVFKNALTAHRHRDTAIRFKSIWLDVDVKPDKPEEAYGSVKEALAGLGAFVQEANLPPPTAIVLSGGGLHVYWISDTPLTPEEWTPYAQGLRFLAVQKGLKCDAGLTTDRARVLRVPGTFNYKTAPPRAVKLAGLSPSDLHFPTALSAVAALKPEIVTAPVTAVAASYVVDTSVFPRKPPLPASATRLTQGLERTYDDAPIDYTGLFTGCPHFQDTYRSHGASCGQGLWMLDVLACTFVKDGAKLAHKLSSGHPGYSPEETDRMFARKLAERDSNGLGWPGCHAFASEGSSQCAGCPFNGKIKSPLNLCTKAATPAPKKIYNPPPAGLMLPDGYVLNNQGVICKLVAVKVKDEEGNATVEDDLRDLFNNVLSDPELFSGEKRELWFRTTLGIDGSGGMMHGPVAISDEDLVNDNTLMTALRSQGVNPKVENEGLVRAFMSSWVSKIEHARKRTSTVPYGWIFDDSGKRCGFAYGGKAFYDNGTITSAPVVDRELKKDYTPVGTDLPAMELLKIITDQHHPALEVIAATSFAGPLMFITGQKNGVFCAYSDSSGAHKSTSVAFAAGVWGNPQRAQENSSSSQLGIQKKLGLLKNLSVYIDEIALKEEMENVRKALGIFTQGGGGTKLDRNRNTRHREEWQSLVCLGANVSLRDCILDHSAMSDARLQRVFEFEVEKRDDSTLSPSYVERLATSINQNFGHIGLKFAEYIGKNHKAIDAEGDAMLKEFERDMKVKDQERFWSALVVTTVYGAILANRVLGHQWFHHEEIYRYLVEKFEDQRKKVQTSTAVGKEGQSVLYDLMTTFFKANIDSTIWTAEMVGPGVPGTIIPLHVPPGPRRMPINIQWCVNDRKLRISRKAFNDFCQEKYTTMRPNLNAMKKILNADFSHRANLCAGTTLPTAGREHLIVFPITPGHEWWDNLFAHSKMEDRPADYGLPPTPTGLLEAALAVAADDMATIKKAT